ncbi:MAG: nitrate/nitrite two-component system sensor histidine kinase NarQ [Aeromonas sp.]
MFFPFTGKINSVNVAIRRAMALILLMSAFITFGGMITLSYSSSDAKAINLSGSLRMQAYRMAYEIERGKSVLGRLEQFERTLHAPELIQTQQCFSPAALRSTYQAMFDDWRAMRQHIELRQPHRFADNAQGFVATINEFVQQMQRHVEFKVHMLMLAELIGIAAILLIAGLTIRFVRRQIALPLNQLVNCAEQIQRRDFDLLLPANNHTEIGALSLAFAQMADELKQLYYDLEQKVEEKTGKLLQANDSLSFLYSCAQKIYDAPLTEEMLVNLLDRLAEQQQLDYVRLTRFKNLITPVYLPGRCGWPNDVNAPVQSFYLKLEEKDYGRLDIITHRPIDQRLITNLSMLLTQVLHKKQHIVHQQRFLLMEERAVIARELHDSLAQALSFLKIQATLLKRAYAKGQTEKTQAAMQQIDEGLGSAYTQLRELLTTFRLTVGDADLGEAIRIVLEQLQPQTSAELRLYYELSDTDLAAGQHIHILQLIREAVLNAMKHANAATIEVSCKRLGDGNIEVHISDDGVGIGTATSATNHYGLSIMNERASKLAGVLTITEQLPQGTLVHLTFPTSLARDA